MQVPAYIAMTEGPEHRFVMTNPLYNRLLGDRNVIGKTLREALPELPEEGAQFVTDVYQTGMPYVGKERKQIAELQAEVAALRAQLKAKESPE